MNKLYFIVLLLIMCFPIFSNDTHIKIGAGGISYFSDKEDKNISLEKEDLKFTLFESCYKIEVIYDFYNNSNTNFEYDIGFPVRSVDTSSFKKEYLTNSIPLDGFHTTVNGLPVEFILSEKNEDNEIVRWYMKKVIFSGNSHTSITVSYKSEYGASGGLGLGTRATYFYGSGYIWNGPIKELNLFITNNSEYFLFEVENIISNNILPKYEVIDSISSKLVFKNIEPDRNSAFELNLHSDMNIGFLGNRYN